MYALMVGGLAIRGSWTPLFPFTDLIHKVKGVSMKICSIEGCENKYYCKTYCIKHYNKFIKYGDPIYTILDRDLENHGMTGTPEYAVWANLRNRCYYKNNNRYHRYGGRGITVCERWLHSFSAFYADMGPKPFKGAQIDRIDNDGNYEPTNCRWVTCAENRRNAITTKLTEEKVKQIRKLCKVGRMSQRAISLLYGIHESNVSLLINNKTWI